MKNPFDLLGPANELLNVRGQELVLSGAKADLSAFLQVANLYEEYKRSLAEWEQSLPDDALAKWQALKSHRRDELFLAAQVAMSKESRTARAFATHLTRQGLYLLYHVHALLTRLHGEGLNEAFATELNKPLAKFKIEAKLQYSSDLRKFVWSHSVKNEANLPLESFFTLRFAALLEAGELDRLRRCNLEDCGKFFIGNPKAKWCSESCGSKNRGREKRKRDSEKYLDWMTWKGN